MQVSNDRIILKLIKVDSGEILKTSLKTTKIDHLKVKSVTFVANAQSPLQPSSVSMFSSKPQGLALGAFKTFSAEEKTGCSYHIKKYIYLAVFSIKGSLFILC